MDRIDTDTKAVDLFGAGKHGFKDGDLAFGVIPTDFDAQWCNAQQEEKMSVIEGAGVVPVTGNFTQLRQALKRMFGGNVTTVNAANSPLVLTADHAGLVLMDATAGNASAVLLAANVLAAIPFRFVRLDATANTATVNRGGADTFVGGATSFTLVGQGDWREISGDATSKWAMSPAFASTAEAQALAAAVKMISPASLAAAFKGGNQSLAGSGYQKLPGGMILQWGFYQNSSTPLPSGGTYSAPNQSFPIAFPTDCLFLVGSSTLNYVIAQASYVSASQFSPRFSTNQAGALNVNIAWLAIGH